MYFFFLMNDIALSGCKICLCIIFCLCDWMLKEEVDEKKYCKICKVSFSQPSQADMHYNGKNHAKKLKNCGGVNGNG